MGNIIQRKINENNEVKAVNTSQKAEIKNLLESRSDIISACLPSSVDATKFNKIILNMFNNNEKLASCSKLSIIAAAIEAAVLGLEPNTQKGECYIIPYGTQAQFQMGYKGYLELAYRSDRVKSCKADIYYSKDHFDLNIGTDPYLIHKPYLGGKRGDVVGYYAVIELTMGGKIIHYMSKDEVVEFRNKFIKTSSVWDKNFNAMAKKTVLKQVFQYVPKSVDDKLSHAASSDDTIREDIGGKVYYGDSEEIDNTYGIETEVVSDNLDAIEGQ